VIQPHLPVRLPCYDFVPVADPTFIRRPPFRVRLPDFRCSPLPGRDGRCVQGPGTYSPHCC